MECLKASIVNELVNEFAYSNSAPTAYYYEFGFGTSGPLVEEREFPLYVGEYTHEYYTWECII